VQGWYRQFGFWEADLPTVVPWLLVVATLAAVSRLDGDDLRQLRGATRALMGGGVALLLVAIYAAAYVYFTDRADYAHIGLQMARYSSPLAALAAMAWSPRLVASTTGRLDRRWAVALVAAVPMVAVGASVVTWLSTGANTPLG